MPIERKNAMGEITGIVGELFFFKLKHWGTVLKGEIFDFFNQHRFKIRNSGKNLNFDYKPKNFDQQPEHVAFEFSLHHITNSGNNLSLFSQ